MFAGQAGGMDLIDRATAATRSGLSERARLWLGKRNWDNRADHWDHGGATGLSAVFDAVIEAAAVGPETVVVDLGCGSGQLSVPLAHKGAAVTAVDISPRMAELVRQRAAEEHLDRLTAQVAPVEHLVLPPASVDVVVTNYAMHHVRDNDKLAVVRAAAGWLKPGGRLVVGDMMFGRGASPRDREIIKSKALTMLSRGPAGWWRLAKNVFRFSLRVRERPVSMETWVGYFKSAGLVDVTTRSVVSEAGVVVGRKP